MSTIWVVRASTDGARRAFLEHRVVAITGAGRVQDDLAGADKSEIARGVRAAGLSGRYTTMLDAIVNQLATGDIVVMPDDPRTTRTVHVAEVVGAYRYLDDPPVADAVHARPVEWLGTSSRDLLGREHFARQPAVYRVAGLTRAEVLRTL